MKQHVFWPPFRPPIIVPDTTRFEYNVVTAVRELDKVRGAISGHQMAQAILNGTKFRGRQEARLELKEFSKWAEKNRSRLSSKAKKALDTYERYALAAIVNGQTSIAGDDYDRMRRDLGILAYNPYDYTVSVYEDPIRQPSYLINSPRMPGNDHDLSAMVACFRLASKQEKVSAEDMVDAIYNGTSEQDNQAVASEFDTFQKWADSHRDKLFPEAREVMRIYKKYAEKARSQGQIGLCSSEFESMFGEMRSVAVNGQARESNSQPRATSPFR